MKSNEIQLTLTNYEKLVLPIFAVILVVFALSYAIFLLVRIFFHQGEGYARSFIPFATGFALQLFMPSLI